MSLTAIRTAVAARLTSEFGASLPGGVVESNHPRFERENYSQTFAVVAPAGRTTERVSRTSVQTSPVIQIAVIAPDIDASDNAASDPLILLCEQIQDDMQGKTFAGSTCLVCQYANEGTHRIDQAEKDHEFRGILTLQMRGE